MVHFIWSYITVLLDFCSDTIREMQKEDIILIHASHKYSGTYNLQPWKTLKKCLQISWIDDNCVLELLVIVEHILKKTKLKFKFIVKKTSKLHITSL